MSEGPIETKSDPKEEERIRNEKIKKLIQDYFDIAWKTYKSKHVVNDNQLMKVQKAFVNGFNAAIHLFQKGGAL